MIKYINNNNNLIVSHIADVDGMGAVILAKLVFENIDIILCEPDELYSVFKELIGSKYNQIFITDLSIKTEEIFEFIDRNFSNVKHFDHHIYSFDIKYPWSTVIHKDGDFLPCGTSIFYEYLLNNYTECQYLNSTYVSSFVENVRSYDTWDFKNTGNLDGKYLTEIFSVIGIDSFIEKYYLKLLKNYRLKTFTFDKDELVIVKKLEDDIASYVDECDKSLIITQFLGYNVGISISENYRSTVGNELSARHKELDFILIANFVRRAFSFRTVNDINLNEIASIIGGGGHEKAAGASMNDENLKIFYKSLYKKYDK